MVDTAVYKSAGMPFPFENAEVMETREGSQTCEKWRPPDAFSTHPPYLELVSIIANTANFAELLEEWGLQRRSFLFDVQAFSYSKPGLSRPRVFFSGGRRLHFETYRKDIVPVGKRQDEAIVIIELCWVLAEPRCVWSDGTPIKLGPQPEGTTSIHPDEIRIDDGNLLKLTCRPVNSQATRLEAECYASWAWSCFWQSYIELLHWLRKFGMSEGTRVGIDRYLASLEPEGRCTTEKPLALTKKSRGRRLPDYERRKAVWGAVKLRWDQTKSYAKCRRLLIERHPTLLNPGKKGPTISDKTLKGIIREGLDGLLDHPLQY